MAQNSFSIKKIYQQLRGQFSKVDRRKLYCNNQGHPKWRFIMFIALNQRLYTKDQLDKWSIHTSLTCALCDEEMEDHQHLFFKCLTSGDIWQRILNWQGVTRGSMRWREEVQWANLHAKGILAKTAVFRMSLTATVYHIWMERNHRILQQRKQQREAISRQIIQDLHCRASMFPRLAGYMLNLNFYR
ncbi:hypothetical protein P3L10_018176 [Capsicum annuum]